MFAGGDALKANRGVQRRVLKKAATARFAPNDQSRPDFGGNMRKSAELFLARMGIMLALAFLASFVLLVR